MMMDFLGTDANTDTKLLVYSILGSTRIRVG